MPALRIDPVWSARILSVMRIVIGLIVLEHGMQKLFGFPPGGERPPMMSLHWWAGVIEFVGGALLLVGLFTQAAAFILSGEMAFAYFLAHAPRNIFPALSGGDLAVALCFVLLYLAAAGGGPWSVDGARRTTGVV